MPTKKPKKIKIPLEFNRSDVHCEFVLFRYSCPHFLFQLNYDSNCPPGTIFTDIGLPNPKEVEQAFVQLYKNGKIEALDRIARLFNAYIRIQMLSDWDEENRANMYYNAFSDCRLASVYPCVSHYGKDFIARYSDYYNYQNNLSCQFFQK